MIVLTTEELLEQSGVAGISCAQGNALLAATADSDTWLLQERAARNAPAEAQPLAHWLNQFLSPRPSSNSVILFFPDMCDTGRVAVDLLWRQVSQFDIRIAIMLLSPQTADEVNDALFDLKDHRRERLIYSVTLVGKQDASGTPITEERRRQTTRDLLSLILHSDDALLSGLGLFPGDGMQPPFAAIGLESRSRRTEMVPQLLQALARSILTAAFDSERARIKNTDEYFKTLAHSLLERLGSLHTPRRIDAGETWDVSLPDVENAFEAWVCPWFKQAAAGTGEEALRRQKNLLEAGYRRLLDSLNRICREIREAAGHLKDQARGEIAGTARANNDLGGIAHLLRSYFPAFAALKAERFTKISARKTPCSPAASPSLVDAHHRFVGKGREKLATLSAPLLTGRRIAAFGGALALGVFLTIRLLAWQIDHWSVWLPCSAAVLANIWLVVRVWWVRHRASAELSNHVDDANQWLRREFADKIRWVVGKTQVNLESRVCSEGLGMARRLQANMDVFLREWMANLQNAAAIDETRASMLKTGFSDADIDEAMERIREISAEMVDAALDSNPDWEAQNRIRGLFADLVAKGVNAVEGSIVSQSSQNEWLRNLSRQPKSPHVLARLDDAQLTDHLVKCFLLPASYDRSLGTELEQPYFQQTAINASTWFGGISGPAVWLLRRFLDRQEAERALTQVEIA